MRKNPTLRYPTYLTMCIELYLINIRNAREYSKRDDSLNIQVLENSSSLSLSFLLRYFPLLDDEKGIDLTAHWLTVPPVNREKSRHYKSSRTVKPSDTLLKPWEVMRIICETDFTDLHSLFLPLSSISFSHATHLCRVRLTYRIDTISSK